MGGTRALGVGVACGASGAAGARFVEVGTRVGYLRADAPAARAPLDAEEPIIVVELVQTRGECRRSGVVVDVTRGGSSFYDGGSLDHDETPPNQTPPSWTAKSQPPGLQKKYF